MLKRLNKKYLLFAVVLVNIFLCTFFMWGCGHASEKISLREHVGKSQTLKEAGKEETEKNIYVYIFGAIKKPGVYTVKEGSRIFQVIDIAGGMKKNAKEGYLNQAETVTDGQSIRVLTKRQYNKVHKKSGVKTNNNKTDSGKININSGDVSALMQLSGIGETKAKAIIAYREKNGHFSKIEDIKNVSGIGDSTFSNISADITVD